MCGIAGHTGPAPLPYERLDACLRLMVRRGPDHQAWRTWRSPSGRHTTLLASRLSIIDLDERSNQPLAVGPRWVAFNGELFNYRELRTGLEGLRTSSDTEVLLAMLARDGLAALDRFEGMWAFAVYDERDGSLVLSRDRFGEKPLYVHRDETGLYFGSEPKFVNVLLGRTLPVDLDQVRRFLVNGYKALYKDRRRTFYTALENVEPGTVTVLDAHGGEQSRPYWSWTVTPEDAMEFDDAVSTVRRELVRSMDVRLRSDVPLAFCMSGGVDSNALIAVAHRELGHDVHGFTIRNTDERYEEQDVVDEVVSQLGIKQTSVDLHTHRFLERLRELVAYHDAPVLTITYYAQWLLMEAIADSGYRVSVSGTGADELFSGYYDHHLQYLHEVGGDPAARAAWERKVKPYVRNPFLQDPGAFVRNPAMRDHIYLEADEFSGRLTLPWSEPFAEAPYSPSLLRNRMLNELFHESVPVILHEDDLNAMYFSVENRSPSLDRGLFDVSARIPSRLLVREGFAKAVLREAVRGIVPDVVLDNPRKVGFNAPIHAFLDVADPAVRAAVLADSPVWQHVRRDAVQALLDQTELPDSESKFLFSLLSVKMFLETCS